MNGLDLFSGIGGITMALDGYVRPVAYCEIDAYARSVLLSRMADGSLPLAPIWDDVTSLHGWMLPHIDIIYGGFPCQDLSLAGRRAGLEGGRSGLFFQICRLAKETKAPFLFLENVPGIRTKGLGRVLKELDSLGYDCRWGLLSAADVGANHKRQRWFLLAHAELPERRQSDPSAGGLVGQGCIPAGWQEAAGGAGIRGSHVADAASLRRGEGDTDTGRLREGTLAPQEWTRPSNDGWWTVEPNVGRVAYGIPARVDRLRALGNAVVPLQAREAFERLMGLK